MVLQWIRIIDNTPPVVSWLADYTGYANPHDCNAIVDLPSRLQRLQWNQGHILYSYGDTQWVPSVISGSFAMAILKEFICLPTTVEKQYH